MQSPSPDHYAFLSPASLFTSAAAASSTCFNPLTRTSYPSLRMAAGRPTQAPRRRPHHNVAKLGDGQPPSSRVRVVIDAPEANQRVISACNLINAPMHIVWSLLSEYDRLADHVPNLETSQLRPHPSGGIRLEQRGTQSILGFSFSASLVMDMTEITPLSAESRAIGFTLVSSNDFRQFQGEWRMLALEETKTALYYSVSIIPRGLVPVRAIEWRISEDVPQNMDAVKAECERRRRVLVAESRRARSPATGCSDEGQA